MGEGELIKTFVFIPKGEFSDMLTFFYSSLNLNRGKTWGLLITTDDEIIGIRRNSSHCLSVKNLECFMLFW